MLLIEQNQDLDLNKISSIKLESVITIEGEVSPRDQESINKNITTGEIEIKTTKFNIESAADQIPFQINDHDEKYPEDLS